MNDLAPAACFLDLPACCLRVEMCAVLSVDAESSNIDYFYTSRL
jgi:hypothetical protein